MTLDYFSPPPDPRIGQWRRALAGVMVAMSWILSLLLLAGVEVFIVTFAAVGSAVAVSEALRPGRDTSSRRIMWTTAAFGVIALISALF
jgi:hypothetical protein